MAQVENLSIISDSLILNIFFVGAVNVRSQQGYHQLDASMPFIVPVVVCYSKIESSCIIDSMMKRS